ncbi:DNA primase [Kutzneria buriramensis]|uniref:DNA primase n=1 Tax=Kutzneria buriramensis TaxID=1045776 RepID=A0A3E0HCK4_9PSEU|nr:DNA primase [Kutzneria buriramensis]
MGGRLHSTVVAGRIRDSDIAEVRDRNRIDEVVGEYVALRRAGGGALKGLCPFHDEKTPSFNVRSTHGTFHCFGCGEGGDVIAFVMKIDHLSFVESVERLAERVGIQLTYEGGGASVQRDRGTRSRMLEAHRAASEFYMEQLRTPDALKARAYLAERDFDEATASLFGCGFAPAGWDSLTKHLLGRGFELDELYKAGLSREGQRGPMDRFHRRLLWPLKDLGGDVVGFGARRLFDDDRIEAKYVNTAETPIFKKSQVLFGIDLAKREIARRHQVVVVEGYTDVMAMHAAGVPTAVAACGTAFGSDHISVLRRLLMDDDAFRGEVIFTFDGDAAGQKAALKAFEDEQKFAAQTFICVAPDGMDPCELRQAKGETAVRDLVARRQPLFTFAIKALLAEHDLDTAEGRVDALRRAVPMVAQIKDVSLRDEYARQLAGWVGWEDTNTVVRRVRESAGGSEPARRGRRVQVADPSQGALGLDVAGPARPRRDDPALWTQREALKVALQAPALAGPYYDSLPEDSFSDPAYLELHRGIIAAGGASCGISGPAFVDAVGQQLQHQSLRSLLTELAVEPLQVKSEVDIRYVEVIVARLQETLVAKQVADLKSRLQRLSPIENVDEYRELFGDLVALEQYRKALREQGIGGF